MSVRSTLIYLDDRRLSIVLVLLMATRAAWLLFPFEWESIGISQPPRNTVLASIAPLWVWGIACLICALFKLAAIVFDRVSLRSAAALMSVPLWSVQGWLLGLASNWHTEISAWFFILAAASSLTYLRASSTK